MLNLCFRFFILVLATVVVAGSASHGGAAALSPLRNPMLSVTAAPTPAAETKLAIWSEFIPYAELENELPRLRAQDMAVYVAFHLDSSDYNAFAHLLKTAAQVGVEIRPWLLLSEADGYWFNKWNVNVSRIAVHRYLEQMDARGVQTKWLIFDVEPPHDLLERVQAMADKKNLPGSLDILKRASSSASIKAAIQGYRSLVGELHARQIRVEAVTTQFVLHDLGDSTLRLQSALGTPITGVPWDRVSFMLYRVEFERLFGKFTSRIVYLYAKRARAQFGERAAIDVGEAGHVKYPKPFDGFSNPADLQNDIAAVRLAGLSDIHIYSLDGLRNENLHQWTAVPPQQPNVRHFEIKTAVFIAFFDLMRGLLPAGY